MIVGTLKNENRMLPWCRIQLLRRQMFCNFVCLRVVDACCPINFLVSRTLGAKYRSSLSRVITRRHFDTGARKPCSVSSHWFLFFGLGRQNVRWYIEAHNFSFLKSVWSSTPQVYETFLFDISIFLCKVTFLSRFLPSKTRLLSVEPPNSTHPTTKVDSLYQFDCYCADNWNALFLVTGTRDCPSDYRFV